MVLREKVEQILKSKNITYYQLSKIVDFDESTLNKMLKSKMKLSGNLQTKILPILEVSKEDLNSWILADKYPKEVLEMAINLKKESTNKNKILTTKIDSILQEKNMSRTALAKQIKYDQSGLNRMIIGKDNVSKSVIQRLSSLLDIPENEILAWVVADKYSLELITEAYKLL